MGLLSADAIAAMGFKAVGRDVRLSDRASFYNCAAISLGDRVRIDDFCVLSAGEGGIDIGSHIHIAVYTSLIGGGRITLRDFCNLSSRVSIYSSNDDYSGAHMTNPMVPEQYTGVTHAPVTLGKHVIVGCASVILPGSVLGEGAAIGSLSLVQGELAPFGVYAGTPARFIKERQRDLLALEAAFLADLPKASAQG
jgi:acetyltransferase-like isoleucine patch superfamily enzyme